MKMILLFTRQLLALLMILGIASSVHAQSHATIKLHTGEIDCFENIVLLKHVAGIQSRDSRLLRTIESLELDSFDQNQESQQPIEITKQQIRYGLLLAGLTERQFEISGPDRLTVVSVDATNFREVVENRLNQQVAEQYMMSPEDLKVTLDQRFDDLENPDLDYSTLTLHSTLETELQLGNQKLSAMVEVGSGDLVSREIPVVIALVRDLVIARKNISKGETLSADNLETVRRPVASRNVQFASFEQVVGKQSQNNIQQFDLIKSNLVRPVSTREEFTIKKNSHVNVIVRRGGLTVTLTDAKALDDGNVGDFIGLTNQKTKERIFAKVVDSATAEIRF